MLPHNPESSSLEHCSELILRRSDGSREEHQLVQTRRHKRFRLLQLERVGTADQADELIGSTVFIRRSQLAPCAPNEVYHIDLIGCAVQTEEGDRLGQVEEVLSTGSNDVCVIRDGEREILVPLIADVIVRVDAENRIVVVRPLPGLLDS
jgi:16S rRNA processing protein RimM